ncbi:MAG: hypothetical protein HP494_16690 [Nitrospira sp.]|nr:hypothetical protein [Nitrospira sp.]
MTRKTDELTLIREQVNDIVADVRLDAARSGMETAYATFRASLGEDAVPVGMGQQDLAHLTESLRTLWEHNEFAMPDAEGRPVDHGTAAAQ